MGQRVVLSTDGSEASIAALEAGLRLIAPDSDVEVVTVSEAPSEGALVGSGHAGPLMTQEEFDAASNAAEAQARDALASTISALGLSNPSTQVIAGEPGRAICAYAEEVEADAIVLGTRGRSGLKRAVLGSVSDHVVRNATCSVVVTPPSALPSD